MKSSEVSASGRAEVSLLDVARFFFFNGMKMSCRGTYGFASLRRVSTIFSIIASIFAMTSEFADRWDDAIRGCDV